MLNYLVSISYLSRILVFLRDEKCHLSPVHFAINSFVRVGRAWTPAMHIAHQRKRINPDTSRKNAQEPGRLDATSQREDSNIRRIIKTTIYVKIQGTESK